MFKTACWSKFVGRRMRAGTNGSSTGASLPSLSRSLAMRASHVSPSAGVSCGPSSSDTSDASGVGFCFFADLRLSSARGGLRDVVPLGLPAAAALLRDFLDWCNGDAALCVLGPDSLEDPVSSSSASFEQNDTARERLRARDEAHLRWTPWMK